MLQFIANHVGFCVIGFYIICAAITTYAVVFWSKVVDPELEDY